MADTKELGERLAALKKGFDTAIATIESLARERDAQYDENINRINAEGLALLRAEVAEAELATLRASVERLEEALEPFALISAEGVVKTKSGHVAVTTCAEYFHQARTALEEPTS